MYILYRKFYYKICICLGIVCCMMFSVLLFLSNADSISSDLGFILLLYGIVHTLFYLIKYLRKDLNYEVLRIDDNGVIICKKRIKTSLFLGNLDVIISVGYLVHSKRGTAFRIWARQIIKDYLVKGYAVNERIRHEQIGELRQLVGMLGRTLQNQEVISNDGCVTVSLTR